MKRQTRRDTDSTYYGSYFDEHDVLVQVFPYDKEGMKAHTL